MSISRSSKDNRKDCRGNKFLELCESYNFLILNGRSAGDVEGEYTFVRPSGQSVIDYGIAAGAFLKLIVDFKVEAKTFSEHMPLIITLSNNISAQCTYAELKLPPRLKWRDNLLQKYQQNLNDELIHLKKVSPVPCMEELQAIMKKACPQQPHFVKPKIHNEKWFDEECETARNRSLSFLNLFRAHNNISFKRWYVEANKKYKALCSRKKEDYGKSLVNLLSEARSATEFWKAMKFINGAKSSIGNNLNAADLKNYFESLLNTECISCKFHYAMPNIEDDVLDLAFAEEELLSALDSAKENKAAGTDRIPSEFFKYASPSFITELLRCYNGIFRTCSIPANFLSSIIFPLFKKGDPSIAENYRGISFLNASMKLFASMIFRRLTTWVRDNSKLSEFQAGFRSGYSTTDQVFVLLNIAETYLHRGKKLYAFFVDFRAAFDSIDRESLFLKLANYGISTKIIFILKALYEKDAISVWDGETLSEEFRSSMGLKQGCSLSTLLFTLFIDDIVESLGTGVKFAEESIPVLLYADDIVILSESPDQLQVMISRLEEYCNTWNLAVNLSKSKIIIFRKGRGRYASNEEWKYKGEEVSVVKEIKYLGMIISSNLCIKKQLKAKLQEAKAAICVSWKKCIANKTIHHSDKYRLFQAVSKSIMMYCAQVWGHNEYEDVEKLLRFFLKRIFALPSTTPNYMLHIETGIPPMFIDTLRTHFDYVVKILQMDASRLVNKVLRHLVSNKLNFVQSWISLSDSVGEAFDFDLQDITRLKRQFYCLLSKLDTKYWENFTNQAKDSHYREYYSRLNFVLGESNYFHDKHSTDMISTILRTRGEILTLNFIPHRPDLPLECDLCNTHERENIAHFLGSCPILQEIRRDVFGRNRLDVEEVIDILNGMLGWNKLYKFVRTAMTYRNRIRTECF